MSDLTRFRDGEGESENGGRVEVPSRLPGWLAPACLRPASAPPVSGDMVDAGRVIGFRYDRAGHNDRNLGAKADLEFDDVIVLQSDSTIGYRRAKGIELTRAGLRPVARLRHRREALLRATDEEVELFESLLDLHKELHRWDVRSLFDTVWRLGYELWLIGGPTRGTLRPGLDKEINDLDCTGTMPVGLLYELLDPLTNRRTDRPVLSGGTAPVVKILEGNDEDPIFEYKPLELRHPGILDPLTRTIHAVSDHDFVHDVVGRDLTINSIAYDPVNRMVLDPGGLGLADLESLTLRPGERSAELDPLKMFVRILKFVDRYAEQNPDLRPAVKAVKDHSHDIAPAIAVRDNFADFLKSAFYSKKRHLEEDADLSRIVAAADFMGCAVASELARLIVERHV
jgi:hypothetical protein